MTPLAVRYPVSCIPWFRVNVGLRTIERTTSIAAQQSMMALALFRIKKLFLSSVSLLCVCVCVGLGGGRWCKVNSMCTMKAYGKGRGLAPLIVNLNTRWNWVVGFTPWPLYSQVKKPSCPLMRLIVPQCSLLKSWKALFSLPHPCLVGEIVFGLSIMGNCLLRL